MSISRPNLRPLSVGEILDTAFRLYRANFVLFIGITAIFFVPFGVLQVLSRVFFKDTSLVANLQNFMTILLLGALTWAASRLYLGLPASSREAFQTGRHRFWSIWGASFLEGLAMIPAIILIALGALGGVPGVVIMALIAVPYIAFITTRWGVDIPAIIVEDLGARPGLDRSWTLTSKDAWHALGTLFTSGLLVYLVSGLPAILLNYASKQYGLLPELGPVATIVLAQLGSLISTPLSISASVILYYDLRVRREGFDLQLILETPVPQPENAHGQ
jgi:hypothetical protein